MFWRPTYKGWKGKVRSFNHSYNKLMLKILGQERILLNFTNQQRSKKFSMAYLPKNYNLNVVYFSIAL